MVDFLCIAGQARSGKNVVGDHICSRLGFTQSSFASPVKDIFCRAFVKDLDFVETWKVRPEPPLGFQKPVRQALQFIGDGFRSINSEVWVDYAFINNPPKSCFTDGRYINELAKIRSMGGMNILLWRPDHENHDINESEAQIKRLVDWFISYSSRYSIGGLVSGATKVVDDAPKGCELVDFFIINDGDLPSLFKKIDDIVIPQVQA